jgi:hypothetical protein
MNMGDRIQRAWQSFVRDKVDAKGFRLEIESIAWGELGDDDTIYLYAAFDRAGGEPYVVRLDGPMLPDYFTGAPSHLLVAQVPLHRGMTKADLLAFDINEFSEYWDHPDWSDG